MTVSKAVVCFTVCVLFVAVGETSAFLPDESISLEQSDVVRYAETVNDLAKEYPEIASKLPSLLKIAGEVAQQGIGVIKANPALGVVIYFGASLLTAYYLTKDAEIQLMKAKFKYEELDMIIDTEILSVLEMLDKAINEGEGGIRNFCKSRQDTTHKDFQMAIESFQQERKKIEEGMIESTAVKTKIAYFQYLSGGVYLTTAACFATGPACPFIAASGVMVSSAVGYWICENSQSAYQKTIEDLDHVRKIALDAEKKLRRARVDINKLCFDVVMINPITFS